MNGATPLHRGWPGGDEARVIRATPAIAIGVAAEVEDGIKGVEAEDILFVTNIADM